MPRPVPAPSTIEINVGGNDITGYVVWALTQFEAQMAAIPGTFTITCRDINQELDFTTGDEVELIIDGQKLYGGYVLQVSKNYFFPADDTQTIDPSEVPSRQWVLNGSDYNILLDKRVLRDPTGYTSQIQRTPGPITDGEVIETYFPDYFDLPAGLTFDIQTPAKKTFTNGYRFKEQGTKMREVLDDLAQYGSVYYIDANLVLHFIPVQNTMAPWGLSDAPDWTTTIGFRDGEMTEDATAVVNDALVWGGSQWAGDGDIVFARRDNATSIANHGRWQLAEVHVGEENYRIQAEVTARAQVIVDGDESGVFAEGSKGLVNPEIQFKGTWFGNDVIGGTHLVPGEVVPITLEVFSATPINLPLRQAIITFPTTTPPNGDPYVQFTGFFGVLMSDPYWLWAYLRQIQKPVVPTVTTANSGTTTGNYGTYYQGTPAALSATLYEIPFSYIGGSTQVYVGGEIQIPNIDYTESSPSDGQITFTSTPTGYVWVTAYLAGAGEGTGVPPPPGGGGGSGGTIVYANPGELAAAIAAASNGDTLTLKGGNHVLGSGLTGSSAFNYGGISTSKYLTIQNFTGESPVITWAAGVRNNGLYFTGSSGPILLDGIAFQATSTVTHDSNGSAMLELDGGDDLTVVNCTFTGHSSYDDRQQLFYQRLGTNIQVSDCTFIANGSDGFGFHQYPADPVNPNCVVQNSSFEGFLVSGGVTSDSTITVDNCVFNNNNIAVQLRNDADNSVITNNSGTGNDETLQNNGCTGVTDSGNTWT